MLCKKIDGFLHLKILTYQELLKKAIDNDGRAYWLVELDGINSFIGDRGRNDSVKIRLKIKRESTLTKDSGIGIDSFLYVNDNDNGK